MPSSNGVYSLPPGYLAVTGATIQASQHNPPLEDIAAALTLRLSRDGTAPMTGPLQHVDGSAAAPAAAFASAPSTGWHKSTNGIGFDVSGVQVAEIGPSGFIIQDKAITLQKLYHPSGPSLLLGTDSNAALTITGAANNGSGLIRLSVAATATFTTGQKKTVSDVLGTTEANGTWTITVIDSTHIDLQGSAFTNVYTSGGTIGGGLEEISLGTGLTLLANVLSASSPSLAGAQGLVITNNAVTPSSKIDITADQVIMVAAGQGLYATAVSVTIDTSTVGAANGLDAGSRGNTTWYNLFLISNGTVTAGLASLSATAPTLPSGYTYFVRLGAMRTDGSGNFYRTRQLGRDTVYTPVTASNTTAPLVMASGAETPWTAIPTQNVTVPATATKIKVNLFAILNNNSNTYIAVAPNNNYSTATVAGAPAGFGGNANSTTTAVINQTVEMLFESANIYVGTAGSIGTATWSAYGWTDKVNAS